jgi:acyl carrier protein
VAEQLLAYVVSAPGAAPGASALRAYLRERLPEYMIPAAFITLDRLPLTGNAKLDRNALPDPGASPPDAVEDRVVPRTDLERVLAAIYSEVLGVETVGIHQSFFDLGGDSLLATQVISRVHESLGVDVPVSRFFFSSSVTDLAQELCNGEPDGGRLETIARIVQRLQGLSEEEQQALLEPDERMNPPTGRRS